MLFTVVIATCNQPDRLRSALSAIVEAVQAMAESQAIVVVDNGSDVPARQTVEAFSSLSGFPVHYVLSRPYNKAAALNKAINAAGTPWLAFTDDDCLPDRQWLASARSYIDQNEASIFSGRLKSITPDFELPRWLKNDELPWSPAFVDYAPLPESGIMDDNERVPFGANIFVKKSIYEQYGGYDEALWEKCGPAALGSEDAEFAIRVRGRGEKMGYCAEALVEHPVFRERTTKKYYLRHIYHSGMREPHFATLEERAPYLYLLKNMLNSLAKSTASSLGGKHTRAMYHLMESARDAGEIRGWMRIRRK